MLSNERRAQLAGLAHFNTLNNRPYDADIEMNDHEREWLSDWMKLVRSGKL